MDIYEAIRNRRSVRAYSSKQVSGAIIERLAQVMRQAPSACNYQPWHFIWVTDQHLRGRIAQASYQKTWLADAPIIVVACGFPQLAYQNMGGHGNSVDIDVAIALDHLTLAAVAEGLGTCWIGAFNETAVKEILGIPPGVKVVAMTPLGYPAMPDLNYPLPDNQRKPLKTIISNNRYAGPIPESEYPGT